MDDTEAWTAEDGSVNGHLDGHYPAYTMVTYERKKYLINV